ncbi:response regulator transcription factor [Devosia salina]|uniref:Response regulator transcription factor n=1 Tax=Devosia salina TaxID=2860336 RepID=A0ABX8WHD5_9HYPH|nr:response regulator transcription factor [Devosia salina]QYO77640.1 response regulator transcription factor [Devosia salina]
MLAPNVILVEDDDALRESLMDCFDPSGLNAVSAGTAMQFYRLLASRPCDVVVLDIGLPDEDGLSILRFLHEQRPEIGVIIMTARGTVADRISGLQTGADLYLVKPVEFEELEAAIRNLSRRLSTQTAPDTGLPPAGKLWLFQNQNLRLIAPDNTPVPLTNLECRLLNVMARAGDSAISRADLLEALGYSETDAGHRGLNAALVRLRAKVTEATGLALPIQTLRGQGYVARNLIRE